MPTLTPQNALANAVSNIDVSSAALTSADAGGDEFKNTAGTFIVMQNTGASTRTVTVAAQTTSRPGDATYPATTVSDVVTTLAAGETRIVGPFASAYTDGNGNAQVTYDDATDVKLLPLTIAS